MGSIAAQLAKTQLTAKFGRAKLLLSRRVGYTHRLSGSAGASPSRSSPRKAGARGRGRSSGLRYLGRRYLGLGYLDLRLIRFSVCRVDDAVSDRFKFCHERCHGDVVVCPARYFDQLRSIGTACQQPAL